MAQETNMAKVAIEKDLDGPLMKIGADATAMFDNSANNPTKRASSEALGPAAEEDEEEDGDDEQDNVDESEDLDPMEKDLPVAGVGNEDLAAALRDDDDDDDDDDDEDEEVEEEDVEEEVGTPVR